MKKIISALFIILTILIPQDINATTSDTILEKRKAITEIAEAYLRKDLGRIQYDNARRSLLFTPEDATSQSTTYLTCADYTAAIYYQAFGVIIPYGADYFTLDGLCLAKDENSWPTMANFQTNDDNITYECNVDDNRENKMNAQLIASGYCNKLETKNEEGVMDACQNIFKIDSDDYDSLPNVKYNNKENALNSIYYEPAYAAWYEAWYNRLEIGDIIGIMYNDGSAHTMIVTEKDDEYINSNSIRLTEAVGGANDIYNFTNHTYTPNLQKSTVGMLNFKKIHSRYSTITCTNNENEEVSCDSNDIKDIRYVEKYAIVRFINDEDNLVLSDSAKSRLKYSNIDIDKTSEVNNKYKNRSYASIGDTITYKIKISNHSTEYDYNDLKIEETIDDNVTIIDNNNGTIQDNKITWNISVPKASIIDEELIPTTIEINYTVKIKDSANNKYIISTGFTDDIKNRTIKIKVGKSMTDDILTYLNEKYTEVDKSKNDFEILNELYGMNIFLNTNFSFLETIEIGEPHRIYNYLGLPGTKIDYYDINILDNNLKKMLIGNYYSFQGSNTNNNSYSLFKNYLYEDALPKTSNSRATEVIENDLQPGDILVVDNNYDNNENTSIAEAYIYIDNKFLKADATKEYSDTELTNLLNSLIGKSYMLLRPIQLIETEHPTITFNSNNSNEETTLQQINYNTTTKLTKNSFENIGYTFKGWNTEADGSGTFYEDEENIELTADITLYAQWEIILIINNYEVDETNRYISKIMVNTEVNNFTSNFILGYGYGTDIDTKTINDKQVLYTGGKTRITKGLDLYREYTNIVIGDINGDGAINSADLLKIRQHLLGTNILTGAYFLSSDINYDITINSADLLRVRQHLLGTKPIE